MGKKPSLLPQEKRRITAYGYKGRNKVSTLCGRSSGSLRTGQGLCRLSAPADNPDTEHYAYGILSRFGIDLENDGERRPFALIGAALSRRDAARDGTLGLGAALRCCVESEDQGEARLRRILVCRRQDELCRVLRPLLSLIASREAPLCHERLLDDLLKFRFEHARQRICLRWAREFYGTISADDESAAAEAASEAGSCAD